MIIFNKYRVRGRTLARINQKLWEKCPGFVKSSRFGMHWGRLILKFVRLNGSGQLTTTYFFRNRHELKLMQDVFDRLGDTNPLKLTVVGCSEGAEVFSIIYSFKKNRPSCELEVNAFDIDEVALNVAKQGLFNKDSRVLSTLNAEETESLFNTEGNHLRIKDRFRQINWHLQDPTCEPVCSNLPKQDVVVANRLLFHMDRKEQYRALKAITNMIRPGGYLFVSGVDLDVRTRIAKEFQLIPLTKLLEEIHHGDETMTMDWPFQRWGLEPLCKKERNWQLRYCSVFQLPE